MNDFQRQSQRRFKAGHAKRSAVEFHVLERKLVRRVIGSDGGARAGGKASNERVPVLSSSERRIHFVARVVLYVFIGQREVMRSDLARYREALRLGRTNELQRVARREMRDVQPAAGELAHLYISPNGE